LYRVSLYFCNNPKDPRDTHANIFFMAKTRLPRLMVAGTGGDCGKTFLTLGLIAAWRRQGVPIVPFKKGPDYIDPAWLTLAAEAPARNLDTWIMDRPGILRSFCGNAVENGINLIESNRGLYDGEDTSGTHSSAELSKLLQTPVLLIIPAVKVTRTAAAIALGLRMMDRDVDIAGVVLNRVATARQESVIRTAIEESTGLPVLGAIPRITGELLSSRHLGLVTPEEHAQSRKAIASAADIIANSVDLSRLQRIAGNTAPLELPEFPVVSGLQPAAGLKVGIFRSSAFTFYYPENLEAIERQGAVGISIDPLKDGILPDDLDAIYIGGGFPETHAASLSANVSFRASVAQAAHRGLPIWAECGGLIFLCRTLYWQDNCYPMAGVFQADVVLDRAPAGHGYEEVLVDRPNGFLAEGTVLRGHEFHYSRLYQANPLDMDTIFKVTRGKGLGGERDGLTCNHVVASYLHLHALGSTEWISGMLGAARNFAEARRENPGI
jgi:cobyrinic acid a,c-diamide synthase